MAGWGITAGAADAVAPVNKTKATSKSVRTASAYTGIRLASWYESTVRPTAPPVSRSPFGAREIIMNLKVLAPALLLGAAILSTSVPALAQQYHQGYTHTNGYAHSNGYTHGNGYARGNGYGYGYGNGYTYYGGHRYWHHHRAYWHNNAWGYYAPSGIFISIPL
jgi:hypothetical protein